MSRDLEILHPERELEINGETVTVREFGFVEGARLGALAKPVIDELADLMNDPEGDIDLGALGEIMARHSDAMVQLMARAVDREPAWVESLSDADGQRLLLTFWQVNSDFFMRRLVMQAVSRQSLMPDSAASTPH